MLTKAIYWYKRRAKEKAKNDFEKYFFKVDG